MRAFLSFLLGCSSQLGPRRRSGQACLDDTPRKESDRVSLGTHLLKHRQPSARKLESLNETHDNDLVPVRDSPAVIKRSPKLPAASFSLGLKSIFQAQITAEL